MLAPSSTAPSKIQRMGIEEEDVIKTALLPKTIERLVDVTVSRK